MPQTSLGLELAKQQNERLPRAGAAVVTLVVVAAGSVFVGTSCAFAASIFTW